MHVKISWMQNSRYPDAFRSKSTASLLESDYREVISSVRKVENKNSGLIQGTGNLVGPVDTVLISELECSFGIIRELASDNVTMAIMWTTESNSNHEFDKEVSCSSKFTQKKGWKTWGNQSYGFGANCIARA